ncbi:MAG TPA: transglycosylase SLT domain-containing protein [Burkholderiaceae bacterium]|jgi:soluble lytic murein transglycosylase
MFRMNWFLGMALIAVVTIGCPSAQAAKHLVNISEDDIFLALRNAALHDDAGRANEYASRLPHYAIPSYVDYYRLRPRIKNASKTEIRQFLTRYDGSAIADRLRNDWLLDLGYKRDWVTFDEQYPLFALDDDTQVKCYALMSRVLKGQVVTDDARALLMSPKDYGDGCQSLIVTLVQAKQFSADDVWAQIRLAAEANWSGVARRIGTSINVPERQLVQAIDHPLVPLLKGPGKGRTAHEIYIVALGRAAKINYEQAALALKRSEKNFTPQELELAWAQIALQASLKLEPQALSEYWSKAKDAPLSNEGYQWKARMALRAEDWKLLKSIIEVMPATLRSEPVWIYWLGRALEAENQNEEARKLFQSIADQTYFYGQLATEALGKKIAIPPGAQPIADAEIAPMAANEGFRRALKFFELDLRFEGVREWNWELRKFNERQHLAAAEFARQSNVLDRMVSTSDRTKTEYDFTQRFPSPHRDYVYNATKALDLDMAWVYGLMRQESRFIKSAHSEAGASGLMQIMPATARYVAKKIGMDGFHRDQVNDIGTNIQLGSNYLNMVLKDMDGSEAMATAAYNAGPKRPRAWRATLAHPVEGAIFAETIPFTETRGYVKNVMSNATYYAALFEGKPQSLRARLGFVAPKEFTASELP